MLIYACVLKSGGVYSGAHVEALHSMLQTHASGRYLMVCLNDVWEGTEQLPWVSVPLLHANWRGWWAKLELFRRDWRKGHAVIYFDLDTVIVGDPIRLLDTPGDLVAVKDWWWDGINSSAMVIRDLDDGLYRKMIAFGLPVEDRALRRLGDQELIRRFYPKCATFPHGLIRSYKADKLEGRAPPAGTVAVQFHGKPKYWECSDGWENGTVPRSAGPAVAG